MRKDAPEKAQVNTLSENAEEFQSFSRVTPRREGLAADSRPIAARGRTSRGKERFYLLVLRGVCAVRLPDRRSLSSRFPPAVRWPTHFRDSGRSHGRDRSSGGDIFMLNRQGCVSNRAPQRGRPPI